MAESGSTEGIQQDANDLVAKALAIANVPVDAGQSELKVARDAIVETVDVLSTALKKFLGAIVD